jgi:hypothetical protein
MSHEALPFARITAEGHPLGCIGHAGIVGFAVCPLMITPFVIASMISEREVLFCKNIVHPAVGAINV